MDGANGSGFDVDHLPYGVVADPDRDGDAARTAVRIGPYALDLAEAAATRPSGAPEFAALLDAPTLNPLMGAGREAWTQLRTWLAEGLTDPDVQHSWEPLLRPVEELDARLPFEVADYVDFYASEHHASNVGRILRPGAEPLLPNWRHLPVGYHGRSGTVVVSGTGVRRPCGQRRSRDADTPVFGPSARLDLEAEVGFVVGTASRLEEPVPASAFTDHVFGVVLLNDWSARDIQAWEYVPLGPFLGKSFATSVAAWVTPLEALDHARVPLPPRDVELLPYLQVEDPAGYDLTLEVEIGGAVVARPPYRTMHWSPAQMMAHLTVNGASMRTGDLFASGTVSGPERDERGCLLELSWGGHEPWLLHGEERTFLRVGDEVVLRATAPGALGPITLAEVSGTILPAHADPYVLDHHVRDRHVRDSGDPGKSHGRDS
ncbi:fumarylacetoacetase [Mumia flava]|uniref:fumarylacetoacetase n=1 Tax=Mumia flava TaxID=1348852 RepID=A0A2M9BH88_9ACTN|nr:fumarylacetoacetase [Mumia flava]